MINSFSDAVVRVGFESATYTFKEGDSGALVVQKSGPISSPITFTAFGTGLVDITKSFDARVGTPDMIMIPVTTVDNDVALEPDLVFIVSLDIIPSNPQIVLDISETVVTIVDNDGRYCTVVANYFPFQCSGIMYIYVHVYTQFLDHLMYDVLVGLTVIY